jgi:sorbitol-specific phosphotransferase system component IIBC
MRYNLRMASKKAIAKRQEEKREEKKFHEELITQMLTLATSGFGIVSALAWNETIQGFVKEFIEPRIPGSGLVSKLIYALLITFLAVLITYQLSKIASRFQKKN